MALRPELEQFVEDRLAAGQFATRADALNAAVAALRRQEHAEARNEELNRTIAAGLKSLAEGRSVPFDEATVDGIKSRGRARLVQQRKPHETWANPLGGCSL